MKRSLESLLQDYLDGDLDGDLDGAARASVEERLARDPAARARLDEMRAAREALGMLRTRKPPPPPLEHIQTRIAAVGFAPRPALPLDGEGTRFYRRMALAATALLAVTIGLWSFDKLGPGEPAPAAEAGPQAPSAGTSRDLHMVVEFGRDENGITADRWLRELERVGIRPSDVKPSDLEYSPYGHVLPIGADD